MKRITDINKLNLPMVILLDINQRITDWIASGGSEEDIYIQKQIIYAERVSNYIKK